MSLPPGPLCSAPPEPPFEGSVEVTPAVFEVEEHDSCQVADPLARRD
jgi:hypothetical protein